MTLTDRIYDELMDGLKKGVNWERFLSKYGTSKGPLYNAVGKLFQGITAQMAALGEERRKTQEELNQCRLTLDSMKQKMRETESMTKARTHELSELQEKRASIEKQIEGLETKLDQKIKFIKQVDEIEKLGFNVDRLKELKDVLTEIGARHGLKGKEAVDRFFDDLKDYDATRGFGIEIQRLETVTETKRLEAEKWQAEAERIERQFKQLREAIDAMQGLLKRGIKPEQIVSWHGSVNSSGGVEAFEEGLNRYGSIEKLLVAKKREARHLDARVAELNGKLNELKEQRAEIEGSVKVLRASAIAEIERVARAALETLSAQRAEMEGSIKTLKASTLNEMKEVRQTGVEKIAKVAQAGSNSLRQIGETALSELNHALSLVDTVSSRALEVGKMIGEIEGRLDRSKETREKIATLAATIERGK